MHFPFFQYFFPQNMLVVFKNVFSNYNTFQFEWNKGPFLDVNLKARFLRGKNAKIHKSRKKIFQLKFPE